MPEQPAPASNGWPTPGTEAPDFVVNDHTGRPVRLSDYRTRPVVLWFYSGPDAPDAKAEASSFRDRISRFDARGVQVFGISFHGMAESAAFAQRSRLNFPLLCDTDRVVGLAYGTCDDRGAASSRPVTCVIDAQGRFVKAYASRTGASQAEDVLADL